MLEFLRDVGKHFTVPYMLAKESVRTRLDAGLSYTEFSYMLLQAADFLHLYRDARGRAPDRRCRPVGQHHGRPRADPARRGNRRRRRPGARAVLPAAARGERGEVRQDRRGDVGLARPGADLTVRLLPVLARRRRQRGGPPDPAVHAARPLVDRGARIRGRRHARAPAAPADAGPRSHRPGPRSGCRGTGRGRQRGGVQPAPARARGGDPGVRLRAAPERGAPSRGRRRRPGRRDGRCRPVLAPTARPAAH